jgi:hypothetical protein
MFSSSLVSRPTVQDETKLKLATWSSAKEIVKEPAENGSGILV